MNIYFITKILMKLIILIFIFKKMKEIDTYQDMEVHAWMPHNTKKKKKQ